MLKEQEEYLRATKDILEVSMNQEDEESRATFSDYTKNVSVEKPKMTLKNTLNKLEEVVSTLRVKSGRPDNLN
jgi:hypothetical protein